MYLYLYDASLNTKKWAPTLARIETRLTDLGIGGKIYRLSPLRNLPELLAEEIRAGAETIIVVGNDATVAQIINHLGRFDATLGIIPVGPDNEIATLLGIPADEQACGVVAARKIERLDLGKANANFFLTAIRVQGSEVIIDVDTHYHVSPTRASQVTICNLRPFDSSLDAGAGFFNPQDGRLEILIEPEPGRQTAGWKRLLGKRQATNASILPFRRATIRSPQSLPVITDGQRVLKTPVKIEVLPGKLKVIVGKERLF